MIGAKSQEAGTGGQTGGVRYVVRSAVWFYGRYADRNLAARVAEMIREEEGNTFVRVDEEVA